MKRKRLSNAILCLALMHAVGCLIRFHTASAGPVPLRGSEDIPNLVGRSTVVCKGRVVQLVKVGEHVHKVAEKTIVSEKIIARLKVDRFYKGHPDGNSVNIKSDRPCVPYPCYVSIDEDDYGLFFLEPENGEYVLADQYFGKLPAPRYVPPSLPETTDPLALLEYDLKATLSETNRAEVLPAVQLLGSLRKVDSTEELKRLVPTGDKEIEGSVYLALMKVGDYTLMEQAATFLESVFEDPGLQSLQVQLGLAIWNIRDEAALPALHKLARSNKLSVRQAAMQALRNIESPRSVPILVSRLEDTDQDVRYLAVSALERTITHNVGPTKDYFRENEQKYLTQWKNWWSTEGKKEYPVTEPDSYRSSGNGVVEVGGSELDN